MLLLRRYAGASEERRAAFMQRSKQRVDPGQIEAAVRRVKRAGFLPAHVGDQAAIGTEPRREARDHEALDAKDARHVADMAGGGAAAADNIAVARVDALIDRDVLDRGDHVVVGGGVDRIGRLDEAYFQLLGDLADSGFGLPAVELDAAAEEIVGVDDAENDIGVGHRRLRAAAAVAGRPRPALALWGPTRSRPPGSTQAMLPPPAPTERTSIFGMPSISMPKVASGVTTSCRLRRAETSKVVPPISTTITLSAVVRLIAAIGASVGPDMTL